MLRSRRVLTPTGERPASVYVRDGRIERIAPWEDVPVWAPLQDYGDVPLIPGVVDAHVHVNEPGRTEWEGFATATRAAAAGGVTTLVDMPLNSIPPTTTVAALEEKRAAAAGQCFVDVGFWGGAVPGNASDLLPMLEAGALGFKCFMPESGVAEFPPLDAARLFEALGILAKTGAPLLVHAESPGALGAARLALGDTTSSDARRSYRRYLTSRPRAAEEEAVERLIRACEDTRGWAHVVHVSSAGVLPLLAEARAAGVRLTAETTPHYLHFESESVPDGATEFKCAPPIRERDNREALWRGLAGGILDAVVSDHSPCKPDLKRQDSGDFDAAWGGIAGVQFSLPVVWTEARRRGHGLEALARWMCEGPARLAGLAKRKGQIAPGMDADLVAFDTEAAFAVEAAHVQHRHALTPYLGERLIGTVVATWLRGRQVYANGQHLGPPSGELLRGRAA